MTPGGPGTSDVLDVLVVGGGPVGLAAAVDAAGRGLRTAVLEPRAGPVDKACGEGLMPSAVAALAALGVHPAGVAFVGISYVGADGTSGGRHGFSSGPGLGVRRTELHRSLAERAAGAGVTLLQGRATSLVQDDDGVTVEAAQGPGTLRARWVLGADGLHSTVRRLLGVASRTDGRRYGLRRHADVAPWSPDVEVHWAPHAEAYVTPVGPRTVGVALLTDRGADFATTLAGFPALLAHLGDAPWTTAGRGAGPLRQQVARRSVGRVLLVGDAAGYVDALTGEGLRMGLATAAAALDAVQAEDPAAYDRRWLVLTRDYRWLTGALVTATRSRTVRRLVVPGSRAAPRAFAAAVDVLAG